jgi:hypothetical protein
LGRRLHERPTSIGQGDTYNLPNARAVATAKPSRLLGAPEPPERRRTFQRKSEAIERVEVEQFWRPQWRTSTALERIGLRELRRTLLQRSEWERVPIGQIIEHLVSNRSPTRDPQPEPIRVAVAVAVPANHPADRRRPTAAPRRRRAPRANPHRRRHRYRQSQNRHGAADPSRRTTGPRPSTPIEGLQRHRIQATSPIRPRHVRGRTTTADQSQAVGQRGPPRRPRRHPRARRHRRRSPPTQGADPQRTDQPPAGRLDP